MLKEASFANVGLRDLVEDVSGARRRHGIVVLVAVDADRGTAFEARADD